MMAGQITVYRSPDNRYRTTLYEKGGQRCFCLSEKTMKGTLLTEFSQNGKIVDQIYYKGGGAEEALKRHLNCEITVESRKEYERVRISSPCKKCNNEGKIARELDLANVGYVENVPVVPIFRCLGCGQRFYGMSEEYLNALVSRNTGLFEKEELERMGGDRRQFVNTLNEYIIRIFASKKITRLVVNE